MPARTPGTPAGADSPGGTGIAGETRPTIAPMADPLASPVGELQEQGRDGPPGQSRAGWPPEVAH